MGNFTSYETSELPHGKFGFRAEYNDINDKKIKLPKEQYARDIDLQEHFPKVFDQQGYSTGTAQAIAAVLEYEQLRNQLDIIPVSRLYLHLIGRGQLRKTFKMANKLGVISEDLLPYETPSPYPDLNTVSPRDRMYQGMLEYARVPNDPEVIKLVLTKGIPIIFGFDIYESFEDRNQWNNDGVMPLPSKGEKYIGTQTGVIVGYSKKKRSVIVRNSWGSKWKNNGHFYIPFNYVICKSCSTLWTIQLKGMEPEQAPVKKKEKRQELVQVEEPADDEPDSDSDESEHESPVIDLKECVIQE